MNFFTDSENERILYRIPFTHNAMLELCTHILFWQLDQRRRYGGM